MGKIRIGIMGTADIALRRFLPAIQYCEEIEYVGVASRTEEAGKRFVQEVGGKLYVGYDEILEDKTIDAIYLPLPPALHYEWTKKAILKGKHVLVEKPFCLKKDHAEELFQLAEQENVVLFENYMFAYHQQIKVIQDLLKDNIVGDIRLIRSRFGFPRRDMGDFRYSKELGGGSLFDCGGYTIKLASILLGDSVRVTDSYLHYEEEEVDLYGDVTLRNEDGLTAQIAFGMDCDYKCELEIWGSNGSIYADRIFTAPSGYIAKVRVTKNGEEVKTEQIEDNHFRNSIIRFLNSIESQDIREEEKIRILLQNRIVTSLLEG